MEVIRNSEFGGERPLFESHNLRLENVIIRAGESAIKECSNIEVWGIERSGFFNDREKWAKGFDNQRV